MVKVYITQTPNDTFLIAGLATGQVRGPQLDIHFKDIRELNRLALTQDVDIIKVSCHILPDLMDSYNILKVGATIVEKTGPKIIAKKLYTKEDVSSLSLAIPGKETTAYGLVLKLIGNFGSVIEMRHDEIKKAVLNGEVDCGLMIHEGSLDDSDEHTVVCFDLLNLWSAKTKLPLPLGVWVYHKDLAGKIGPIERALQESYDFAVQNPEHVMAFVKETSKITDKRVIEAGIKAWVNAETRSLSSVGYRAIESLADAQISSQRRTSVI